MKRLTVADIWQDTVAALRGRLGLLFTIAAPFTLLVDVALSLLGPAFPERPADFTARTLFLLVVLPGLVGAFAQAAVTALVARPDTPPRDALALGAAVAPVYILGTLLSGPPVAIALLLLVLPGLYVLVRFSLTMPVAVLERAGPLAMLERSWRLTGPHVWTIMGFAGLALLFAIVLGIVFAGIGGALAALLALAGLPAVGAFAEAVASGVLSAGITIFSAAAMTVIYQQLAFDVPKLFE